MGTNKSTAVTVIGSINADLVADVESLPERGETIHAFRFQQHLGGKGANQAVATALLGAEVGLVGCVGDDGAGTQALEGLDAAGVNRDRVRVAGGSPTGTALITVDERGDNTIVVVPGANDQLAPSDVHDMQSDLATAAAVVLQLEVPDEVVLAASEAVASLWASVPGSGSATGSTPAVNSGSGPGPGHTVISGPGTGKPWFVFNPSPFRKSALPPAGSIDVLLVNELEANGMSGVQVRNPKDAVRAARELLKQLRAGGCVVVTLGVQGAVALADPTGPFAATAGSGAAAQPLYIPAIKVDAVDTTGAGDVFTGGLMSRLCAGKTLAEALRFATAAAAITVTRPGAQSSFPTPEEVGQMLAEVGDVQVLTY